MPVFERHVLVARAGRVADPEAAGERRAAAPLPPGFRHGGGCHARRGRTPDLGLAGQGAQGRHRQRWSPDPSGPDDAKALGDLLSQILPRGGERADLEHAQPDIFPGRAASRLAALRKAAALPDVIAKSSSGRPHGSMPSSTAPRSTSVGRPDRRRRGPCHHRHQGRGRGAGGLGGGDAGCLPRRRLPARPRSWRPRARSPSRRSRTAATSCWPGSAASSSLRCVWARHGRDAGSLAARGR
jgi:hypothetical protein